MTVIKYIVCGYLDDSNTKKISGITLSPSFTLTVENFPTFWWFLLNFSIFLIIFPFVQHFILDSYFHTSSNVFIAFFLEEIFNQSHDRFPQCQWWTLSSPSLQNRLFLFLCLEILAPWGCAGRPQAPDVECIANMQN